MRAYVTVNVTSRNYKVIPVGITLTLQEKPTANDITVTMDDWTFGEAAKELQVNGLPIGVELTDPAVTVTYTNTKDGTTSSKRPTDAGDYTVKVQYETDTEIHTGTAEFTISPKSIEGAAVTRDQSEQVYDGGEKKPAVTSVVLDGNTLTAGTDYAVAYANNINATKLGPDSQAKIIITGTGNYTGEITVRFPINPVTLRIIGEDRMTATASYGTKVKDIPVSSTTVYYNSSKVTIVPGTWKFDGDGMDEIPEVGNTKVYRAVFTPTSGGENYRECFTYIRPSISQAAGAVTDPAAKTDLVYNGEEQALLGTLPTSSTGTVQYSLDGTNYTETPPTGKEAGTYTVSYKVVGDKNHLDVETQSIAVKIEKLAITVTAENKTSRVGQALEELTYTYTPELAAGDVFTGTLETKAHSDAAGSYSITQGNLALNENYTIDFHAGTYTVANKLAQSDFRFESIPSAVSKTYGDPDFSAGAVGAAEGSTVTYESSAPAVATVDGTGKVTILKAGSTVITATAAETADYEQATATCTLTVEKKPITIPTADATVFTYNGTEQTYALAEDGAYTITGNKQTNANETGYSVTAALKDTVNTQWADGTTADKTYTFVIGKAVITVKAKDQTAYVGDKAPTLGEDSYTVSGLVGEEKLTTQPTVKYVDADGSEIAPDITKTGEVKILAGGAAASGNYTIRYEDGKLTVSTRPSGGGGGSRPSTNPVQTEVSKDPDGTVSLSKTSAAKGDKVTITVKPERHYEVDEVIVRDSKGKQLAVKDNGDGTFTFEMPADKVTVEPTFTWVNPFADVANSAYYVDAVEWMLKREVTQGTTDTTFSPNLNCTRAQIVTFLWRAAGSPAPKGTADFADVSTGSYYAKAVAWAVENGITGGTGNGLFSPDAACTRAQSAAFLYRAAGSPAVSGSAGFSDVAANAYYAQAVAWAKEHGITDGIGGGLFGSANDCTRAQIAAFLWRLYAEK
ncbi:S-layer homology domain-containing protein [Dysosmobacter sp.]|uniref:S-layer homology domain-containing protein n=1 Tax=Dysosmobacter sp. TaxID=2591382 RepID=UPI003AF126FF